MRGVRAVAEQSKDARAIVDEAHHAGLDGSHPAALQAKNLRLELLNVKAALERKLGGFVVHCSIAARRCIESRVSPSSHDTVRTESRRRMETPSCRRVLRYVDARSDGWSMLGFRRCVPPRGCDAEGR